MIPNSVEDIVNTQTQAQRKHNILKGGAIGAGIAVAVSMFALKHDINKIYFDLSKRIDALEHKNPAMIEPPTNYNVPPPEHITIIQPGYIVTESCIAKKSGVYEVRAC